MDKSSYPPEEQFKGNLNSRILHACKDDAKSRRMLADELGVDILTIRSRVDYLVRTNRMYKCLFRFNCELSGNRLVQFFTSNIMLGIGDPSDYNKTRWL